MLIICAFWRKKSGFFFQPDFVLPTWFFFCLFFFVFCFIFVFLLFGDGCGWGGWVGGWWGAFFFFLAVSLYETYPLIRYLLLPCYSRLGSKRSGVAFAWNAFGVGGFVWYIYLFCVRYAENFWSILHWMKKKEEQTKKFQLQGGFRMEIILACYIGFSEWVCRISLRRL